MKMKKNVSRLFFIAVVIISSFYFITEQESTVETLLFDNIEALASGEGGGAFNCYGWGSVDCYGPKVEYMIDGMDLD